MNSYDPKISQLVSKVFNVRLSNIEDEIPNFGTNVRSTFCTCPDTGIYIGHKEVNNTPRVTGEGSGSAGTTPARVLNSKPLDNGPKEPSSKSLTTTEHETCHEELEDDLWNDVCESEWEDIQASALSNQTKPENTDGDLEQLLTLEPDLRNFAEKANKETVDELFKVYLPEFKANPNLTVTPESYYESEPDTLSCCSEPISSDLEACVERQAWELKLGEMMNSITTTTGHVSNYAIVDRTGPQLMCISKDLKPHILGLYRVTRFIGQLMETPEKLSNLIQYGRQLYVPLAKKIYELSNVRCDLVTAHLVEDSYGGFIMRPVGGFMIVLFYDDRCHPNVTSDIINSLVDFLHFTIFKALPD